MRRGGLTIPFNEAPRYYYKDGFYWLVTERDLFQFTEDFFNEWKPGTELFYYKRRELSAIKPLDDRQGIYVMELLKKKIESFIPVNMV